MPLSGPKPPAAGATGLTPSPEPPEAGGLPAPARHIPDSSDRTPGKSLRERKTAVAVKVPPHMGGADKAEVRRLTQNLERSRDRQAQLEGQKFLCNHLDSLSQQLNQPGGAGPVNYRLVFIPRGKPPVSVIPPEQGGADVQARIQALRQQAKPLVQQTRAYFSEGRVQELNRQLAETKREVGQLFNKLEQLQVDPVMAAILPAPTVLNAARMNRGLGEAPDSFDPATDGSEFVLIPQPAVRPEARPEVLRKPAPAFSPAPEAVPVAASAPVPASRKTTTQQWLDFYRSGGRIDGQRLTLDQIRQFTARQMEDEHQYIQLLFPNQHQSLHNLYAPALTPRMIQEIKRDPALQGELQKSLDQMLKLWGLKRTGDDIQVIPDKVKEHAVWVGGFDHNHKRITRVLNCLTECGYVKCAANLAETLQAERSKKGQALIAYWTNAVRHSSVSPLHFSKTSS